MIQAIKKEEAQEKWCPLGGSNPEVIHCGADKCMAWVPCVTIDDKPDKGYCGMVRRGE